MSEQHHDHIWLTVNGESWAIRRIERSKSGDVLFHLWRGYEPNLDYCAVQMVNANWDGYCAAATAMIHAQAQERA